MDRRNHTTDGRNLAATVLETGMIDIVLEQTLPLQIDTTLPSINIVSNLDPAPVTCLCRKRQYIAVTSERRVVVTGEVDGQVWCTLH